MIPKVIHKVILVDDGKIPELPDGMKKAIETYYRMNPGYKVNLFSGNDCVEYIKKHFDERILNAYEKLKPYAYKCDLMRHLILYNEGGWYADARMVCYTPLDILNDYDKEFYVCIDTPQIQPCIWNGFVGSIPKHTISKKIIDLIVWNVEHMHYGVDCLAPTGPIAYTTACIDYLRMFPSKCMIGRHILDNGEQFVDYECGRVAKVKYNNARGADNRDIKGGNDYGEMWRNWDVYVIP
jgi:mannosyltransferase OCH1-like enzyme